MVQWFIIRCLTPKRAFSGSSLRRIPIRELSRPLELFVKRRCPGLVFLSRADVTLTVKSHIHIDSFLASKRENTFVLLHEKFIFVIVIVHGLYIMYSIEIFLICATNTINNNLSNALVEKLMGGSLAHISWFPIITHYASKIVLDWSVVWLFIVPNTGL